MYTKPLSQSYILVIISCLKPEKIHWIWETGNEQISAKKKKITQILDM